MRLRQILFFVTLFFLLHSGCSLSKSDSGVVSNIEKNNNFIEDFDNTEEEVWNALSEIFEQRGIPVTVADYEKKLISSEWLYINQDMRYRYNIKLEKNEKKTSLVLFKHSMKKSGSKWETFESDQKSEQQIITGLKKILEKHGTNR